MGDILCLGAYDELYRIDTSQLIYFEADDHYTNVYYANGTHFVIPFGLSQGRRFRYAYALSLTTLDAART